MKNRDQILDEGSEMNENLDAKMQEEDGAEEKGFLPVSILAAVLFAAIVIVAAFIFFSSTDGTASSSKSGLVMQPLEGTETAGVLSMTAAEYKEPYLIVKITNQSDEPLTYGEEYFLQKMAETGWLNVSPVKHYTWASTSHEIKPGDEAMAKYDLSVYGQLKPGQYRLVKADMSAEFVLE